MTVGQRWREQPRVAAATAMVLIALVVLGALLGTLLAETGDPGRTAASERLRGAEQRIAQRERDARALRGDLVRRQRDARALRLENARLKAQTSRVFRRRRAATRRAETLARRLREASGGRRTRTLTRRVRALEAERRALRRRLARARR